MSLELMPTTETMVRLPTLRVIGYHHDTATRSWEAFMLPGILKNNPISKDWDLDKVSVEVKTNGDVVFWNDGTEVFSDFISDKAWFLRLYHDWEELLLVIKQGKLKAALLCPDCYYAQQSSRFGFILQAFNKRGSYE